MSWGKRKQYTRSCIESKWNRMFKLWICQKEISLAILSSNGWSIGIPSLPSLYGHFSASPVDILLDSDFTVVCFILTSTAVTASGLFLGGALHFWYFMSWTLWGVLKYQITKVPGGTLHIRPNWSPSNKPEFFFLNAGKGELLQRSLL